MATPSTEKEWLETTRGRTAREVEQLVSGHRPGSLPDDVPDSRLKKHRLCLELSGEVFATFREAMAKIRRDAGEPIDEEAAILLLCRQTLEGNRELAECDAQHIGHVDAHVGAAGAAIGHGNVNAGSVRATQTVPPATRRLVLRRDGGRCALSQKSRTPSPPSSSSSGTRSAISLLSNTRH